jgi:hypothetical protein
MTDYGWRGKNESGTSKGVHVIDVTKRAKAVPSPTASTAGQQAAAKVYCTVCGKQFKKAVVMANHFRREHAEMNKSKTTWKQFVQPVEEA